jgi:hypothetical protein
MNFRFACLTAAVAALTASPAVQALNFEVVALSGTTALPFSSGASTSYLFGLRMPTLAEDGWVGFSPGETNQIRAYMVGEPGTVRRVVDGGDVLAVGTPGALRSLRVDDEQRVSVSLSVTNFMTAHLHLTGQAAAGGTVLNKVASPSTTATYNRAGTVAFESLPGGRQLVSAASATLTSWDAATIGPGTPYTELARTGTPATRRLNLPTFGIPGVGSPANALAWSTASPLTPVEAVGGDARGHSFLFGRTTGGVALVDARPDGQQVLVAFPDSQVPGVGVVGAGGITPAKAQFASSNNGYLTYRANMPASSSQVAGLSSIMRYTAGDTVETSRLELVARAGSVVPDIAIPGSSVRLGHPTVVAPDAPYDTQPELPFVDAARGLAVNDAGTIAFVSAATAAPAARGWGVFLVDAHGTLTTLAQTYSVGGQLAPGTDATWEKFHDVTINNQGLAVFSATLVGSDGRTGYWYGRDRGDVQALVVEGQQIEVLPGVFKTVGQLDTGLHELADLNTTPLDDGLNHAGQFAFTVRFTDGTEAVLRTALVSSVPEPSAAWLALAGGALLAGRRRLGATSMP